MDSLKIDSGIKELSINDDPTRIIKFNPNDVLFREKFQILSNDFQKELSGFQEKMNALTDNAKKLELEKEACLYIREKIDYLFGEGTSQIVFQDEMDVDLFWQFFDGLTPYIKSAVDQRVKKYTPKIVKKTSKKNG